MFVYTIWAICTSRVFVPTFVVVLLVFKHGLRPDIDVFRIYCGSRILFHFISKAHFCVIPHLLSQYTSKFVNGSVLQAGPRKI